MSPAFIANRNNIANMPRCQATAKHSGKRCGQVALKGARFCHYHGGLKEAEATARARYGDGVVIVRNYRKQAWIKLATTMPWPEGLPQRPEFLALGVVGRGRLFEAWINRLTDPDTYRHELTRPRAKRTRTG
jgi:hypothetical protein